MSLIKKYAAYPLVWRQHTWYYQLVTANCILTTSASGLSILLIATTNGTTQHTCSQYRNTETVTNTAQNVVVGLLDRLNRSPAVITKQSDKLTTCIYINKM